MPVVLIILVLVSVCNLRIGVCYQEAITIAGLYGIIQISVQVFVLSLSYGNFPGEIVFLNHDILLLC